MALTPEEEAELAELEEEEQAEAVAGQITPALDVMPQALAVQPASTHPGGDEAAANDWVVRGADSTKGTTMVYEPPLTVARNELLAKPQLLKTLFPSEDIPPDFIQMMDENSDIYRTYADFKWGEAANKAREAGATAYRYSRMPWLNGQEGGLSPLGTLFTKVRAAVDPAVEGANALILGVDDTAAFGAGRRMGEALDRGLAEPQQKTLSDVIAGRSATRTPEETPGQDAVRGATSVGGVSNAAEGKDPAEVNDMLIEEYPAAHTLGQIAGVLAPTGLAGRVWKGLTSGGAAVTKAIGGGAVRQAAAKLGTAAGAAAVGGAAVQAGREGVEAAANLQRTGETGTTLEEAGNRVTAAALDPTNLALGVGGEAVGQLAGGVAKGIANSPRFQGAIGRFEQLGGRIKFGRGPVPPKEVDDVIARAKARDISPVDEIAEEISPKIAEVEDQAVKQVKLEAQAQHKEYYDSPEGKRLMPATETVNESVRQLRRQYQAGEGGKVTPVGAGDGARAIKAEFNGDIADVSLTPSPGAIELSADEAEAFLAKHWQRKLAPPKKKPPAGPTPGNAPPPAGPAPANPGGSVNKQGVNVLRSELPVAAAPAGEAPTVPPKGKAAKPAGKVAAAPAREADTVPIAEEFGQARNEYGEAMRPYREAQKADNARAAALGEGTGASASAKITPERRKQVMEDLDRAWSPAEKDVANGHVMARFYEVNDALRTGKGLTGEVKQNFDSMSKAFDKAVDAGHTLPGRTQRGISVSQDELAALEKAETVSAQGFVSQSDDPKIAKQFSEWGLSDERPIPVLFEIDQVSGVPVGKGQGELVHRPGTQYRITGKSERDGVKVFHVEETGYSPVVEGAKQAGAIIGGGLLAVGASKAAGDDESGAAQAAAGGLGLAMLLKKKGKSKVYVTPRRYNAAQHELRKEQLQVLARDPANPAAREAKKLYAASLRDRDQRPMNGEVGGWSRLQQAISQKIGAAKDAAALSAPGGNAFRPLVKYAQQRPGELPLKTAVESAGARAGVTPQLNQLRMLDPLQTLRTRMSIRGRAPATKTGLIGGVADQALLRFAYPTAQRLASPGMQLRGGLLGPKAQQLGDHEREEEEQ